jgi:tetratricopeptide (TPR) repeat protein
VLKFCSFVTGASMTKNPTLSVDKPETFAANERLDSWKEIAAYLRRALRTVQLWEKTEGLPVHRHSHNALSSVFAYKSEVDTWWNGPHLRPQQKKGITLAVLPFQQFNNNNPDEQRINTKLSDQVTTALVRICPVEMGVVARRSVSRFKDPFEPIDAISSAVGASHLIEGNVSFEGSLGRVSVQLISVRDQRHLWAEVYELQNPTKQCFDLAAQIAASVLATLSPNTPAQSRMRTATNSSAQRMCIEGRFHWNKRTPENLVKGIGCFEQALQHNPNCALAYSGMADCYAELGFYGTVPAVAAMKKARTAALKALQLDEGLGAAHASLAEVLTYYEWDLAAAEKEYQRAITLSPDYATAYHWYADYLSIVGRLDEAIANGQRAVELDPVSPAINVWLGMKYYLAGRYDEALEQYKRTLEMHPTSVLAYWASGLANEQQQNYTAAIAEKQKALALSRESTWISAGLGYSYAVSGRQKEAGVILDHLKALPQQRSILSYEIATIYAAMRDENEAVRWLVRACESRSVWVPYVVVEPRLRCLRSDPTFKKLVCRFSLPESSGSPSRTSAGLRGSQQLHALRSAPAS